MALPADSGTSNDRPGPGVVEFEREFAFSDGGERLPWLETEGDEEEPAVDRGRIAGFVALAVLAVALAGTALWFFTHRESDVALVADGSVIEAPDEPYRTRPDDPGGRQVAGTGDTSFEVAEGREVIGRIVESSAPAPTPDAAETPGAEAQTAPLAGIGVQVGAYLSKAAAEAGWSQLIGRLEPLQGRSHRVVEGMADSGKVFRLQAVAGSLDDAQALCSSIKAAGGDCQVKR